jgi:phage terminase large subunit-like protein
VGRTARRVKETRGEINCRWIEEYCRIPEGRFVGQAVKLRPWQRDIVVGIYDSPTRRAVISFGRKNAKTTLSALLLLLHLCGPEARANSQLFSAAQSRDQAALLFSLAAKIVRLSPDLRQYVSVRDTAKQLFCEELGTLYRALSAEASTAYGLSPVFVVHDELGQVKGPRSELYEALETAAGAQEEPLSIVISTQAPTDADLLSVLIDDAKTGADPKVKLWLFTADEAADPFAEATIRQANPAFGDFLNPVEVLDQAASAKRMPAREAAYRNLVLNQRVNTTTPFVSRVIWDICGGEVDESVFRRNCWIGLDLSSRNDLTALAMVGQDDDGIWHSRLEFFAPRLGVLDRAHRDRVPYDVWAQAGHLTLTEGASIEYGAIATRLCQIFDESEVGEIAFDRWRIDVLMAELSRMGRDLPLVPWGQGFKDMTPALDALEHALLSGKFRHGNNPILRWCAVNAVVTRDAAGNRKLDKSKATGRIDGMVALAMAMGCASRAMAEDDISTAISDPITLRRAERAPANLADLRERREIPL